MLNFFVSIVGIFIALQMTAPSEGFSSISYVFGGVGSYVIFMSLCCTVLFYSRKYSTKLYFIILLSLLLFFGFITFRVFSSINFDPQGTTTLSGCASIPNILEADDCVYRILSEKREAGDLIKPEDCRLIKGNILVLQRCFTILDHWEKYSEYENIWKISR